MTTLIALDRDRVAEAPRTYLPSQSVDEERPIPRTSLGVLPLEYRFLSWGARLAAVGLSWVIVEQLLPIQGLGWFVVVAGLANVALLAVGTLVIDSPVAMADRVAQWAFSTGAVIVFFTLGTILTFVFLRGWAALHYWNFFTQTMQTTLPDAPYNQGGILQSIVGTLIELGIAIAITLPLGVATAVYVNEVGGRFARMIRTVVEAMTALPSIVAGLFIYSVWIILLGQPRSGFAGALAISVMMLPIIARASEVVLRVVPGSLREASLGLGASRWRTVWYVVLPDRATGPGHRPDPGGRPRHRRDLAGADRLGLRHLHGHPSDAGSDELAPAVGLQQCHRARAPGGRARLRDRRGPADPGPDPLRGRATPGPSSLGQAVAAAAHPTLARSLPAARGPHVNRRQLRPAALRAAVVALGAVILFATAPAGAAPEYAEIEGSGSTWAYGIIAPWIAQVQSAYGMQITFNQSGSSQGRKDFANGVTDFGDSDIPYQGVDPTTGQTDASTRPYAYAPVVAGGTAFTYHITAAGHLVNNLRLSGETLTKIFTNKITNWADPAITQENGGHALPSETIKPVVRSDGSGATAQFTLWMDKQFPSLWRPFNGGKAGLTSIFPRQGSQIAVAQDAGVMNTIKGSGGEGEIGYTEYSYPLQAHYPVVYVENRSGYFVQPTQYNVAVALTQASIVGCNNNGTCSPNGVPASTYLTQDLDRVYTYQDKRTYPLSSYSYMVVPASKTDQRMTVPKRQTLADFLSYSLCTGQRLAGPYGYSPLPLNLVKAAFGQIEKLGPAAQGGAVAGVHVKNPSANLATCDNPTFVKGDLSANHLAQVAPMPLACQKATSQPCGAGTVAPGTNGSTSSTSDPGGTTTGKSGSTEPQGSTANGGTPTGGTGPPGSGTPVTSGDGTTTSADGTLTTAATTPTATELAAQSSDTSIWGWTAVIELLVIVLLPGLYVAWLRRQKGAR